MAQGVTHIKDRASGLDVSLLGEGGWAFPPENLPLRGISAGAPTLRGSCVAPPPRVALWMTHDDLLPGPGGGIIIRRDRLPLRSKGALHWQEMGAGSRFALRRNVSRNELALVRDLFPDLATLI